MSIALFVVVVVGVLMVRGRGARVDSGEPVATKADYRIKEISLQEEMKDGVRWELQADQAETYEQAGKTVLRKVRIKIQEPERSWSVTGDEGEMIQATKDVVLKGNVVLVSSEGMRLETTRLRWDAGNRRAWTDDPVTVYQKGTMVTGKGLDARVGDRHTEIKGRVQATFGGKSPASPPAAEGKPLAAADSR
ncbi:MAG TPA: LPS export ABC transporter periplasmic protein LptC [Methylomirabilota bacterium]|nr:LPS export ABC transporter periplasmic protein LptC [Methylomirabilota bacterium]